MSRDLNAIMEFDHVIEVHEGGSITSRDDLYAPDLNGDELDGGCELFGSFHGSTVTGDTVTRDRWVLMNGYSGQDRYPGPIMHNSEYIGGGMETDIRENPGVYVALVCYWPPDTEAGESIEDGDLAEGWAVARYAGRVEWKP